MEQDIEPLEIVVSDNHSTDETSRVLADLSKHITIIRPSEHLPMMEHWNFVASNLSGDWFSLLSSDDVALPNYVRTLLRGATGSPEAVLVRAGWENINEFGKTISRRYLLSVRERVKPPATLLENIQGPKGSFAAFATKRIVWKRVGGFPESCRLFGDWGYWIRISPHGDFIYESELISQYRINYREGLSCTRFWDATADEIEICTQILPAAWRELFGSAAVLPSTRPILLRRLAVASEVLTEQSERDKFSETVHTWAKENDCQHAVQLFAGGTHFRTDKHPLRNAVRRVANLVHNARRAVRRTTGLRST
jgi:GT2 family glycosyltransferase